MPKQLVSDRFRGGGVQLVEHQLVIERLRSVVSTPDAVACRCVVGKDT